MVFQCAPTCKGINSPSIHYSLIPCRDDNPRGLRAPVGVASNLVVCTNTPHANVAAPNANARTNIW